MDAIIFLATFSSTSFSFLTSPPKEKKKSSGTAWASAVPHADHRLGRNQVGGWRGALGHRGRKGPHVPARARARLTGLAWPPLPPGRSWLPLPSPHTLAHALWLPHAHVLNRRRPSCRLQLLPGLPASLRTRTSLYGRKITCHSHTPHCPFQRTAGSANVNKLSVRLKALPDSHLTPAQYVLPKARR